MHGYNETTRTDAIDILKTMESLAICARQGSSAYLRRHAIYRIHDGDVLEKLINDIGEEHDVVYEMKFPGVLDSLVEQAKKENILERLTKSKNKDVRSCVVSEIIDTALLARIARNDDDVRIRYKAAKRLPEEMFAELRAQDPEIGEMYISESECFLTARDPFTDDSSDWVRSITERD